MPACSIVIRAYNEEKHIGRLLEGISKQTVQDVQVILVDSGSTDGTRDIASRYPVEIVSIKPEEFSFGRSLNRGIAHCKAEILVFASAHVYPVYPDWLEQFIKRFEDQNLAACYGKQRGAESSKFSELELFKHWYLDTSEDRQTHPFCNNANIAVRKSLWEQHPYDERIPALEDLAWAKWAFEKGHHIAYAAEAEVIHVHQETWKGVKNRYYREGIAFKQIYPNAKFSFFDLGRLLIINSISDAKAAFQSGFNFRKLGSILRFRWAQFSGTYLGYRKSSIPLTSQLKQAFYYPKSENNNNKTQETDRTPIEYTEQKFH